MGGCSFLNEIVAATASEGFNILYQKARQRYGDDPYNGSISTCSLGYCSKTLSGKYSEGNAALAEKHISEEKHYGRKWYADYVNAGLVGYRVTTVEEEVVKHGEAKSIYVIYDDQNVKIDWGYDKLKIKDSALSYAKNNPGCKLRIRREVIYSNRENDDLYRYKTTSRIVEKEIKGKKNEKVVPVYKFYFYGFAGY